MIASGSSPGTERKENNMQHQDLEKFAQGALSQQINRALAQVASNIQDPNTDPKKTRKIVATITFKPNDERDLVLTNIETKATLAPTLSVSTAMNMGINLETGEVECVEVGKQIPGQMSIRDFGKKSDEPKAFDQETGEIFEEQENAGKVVNLRNKQA